MAGFCLAITILAIMSAIATLAFLKVSSPKGEERIREDEEEVQYLIEMQKNK